MTPSPDSAFDAGDTRLIPFYTFEEFVVGPHNRFPHAASLAVSENLAKAYNPLFLYGPVGIGKTHLMQSVGHRVLQRDPKTRVLYVTAQQFMTEVIELLQAGKLQTLRDRYRSLDLLLVDDIQFLATSEATQEEFFHMFNDLHSSGKQIIMTSDRPPKMLTTLEDRLRSRFEWGLIADIKLTNLETRVAILKKKESRLQGIRLNDDIRLYIASRLKSNIRELEGFLRRIQAYTQLYNETITLPLVKEILKELLPPEEWALEEGEATPSTEKGVKDKGKDGEHKLDESKDIDGFDLRPASFAFEPLPTSTPKEEPSSSSARTPEPLASAQKLPSTPNPEKTEGGPPRGLSPSVPEKSVETPSLMVEPPAPTKKEVPLPVASSLPKPVILPTLPLKGLDPSEKGPGPSSPPVFPKPPLSASSLASPLSLPAGPLPGPPLMSLPPVKPPIPIKTGVPISPGQIPVVFFYPTGHAKELVQMKRKFEDIINKHKLKFVLHPALEVDYTPTPTVAAEPFVEKCQQSGVSVAVVLGPPPGTPLPESVFFSRLQEAFDQTQLSLQMVPWDELGKDYRFLNLALDITLIRIKQKTSK